MRKLFLLSALLIGNTTYSQEAFNLTKQVKCGNAEFVMNHFAEKFGELPIWAGKTYFGTHMTLMYNKEKRTWTIVEYEAKIACVIGSGDNSSSPDLGIPTSF